MKQIFVHDGTEQLGPYDESMLRAAIAIGDVSPEHHYWEDGLSEWQSLAQSPYAPPPPPAAPEALDTPSKNPSGEVRGFDAAVATAQMNSMMGTTATSGQSASQKKSDSAKEDKAKMDAALVGAVATSAIVAGTIGLVSGVLWAAMVLFTGVIIGWLSWGIGAACGFCVSMCKGEHSGPVFGLIAFLAALGASLIGYYAIFVEILRMIYLEEGNEAAAAAISVFSPSTLTEVLSNLGSLVSPLDFFFVIMAVFTAWGVAGGSGMQQEE